MFMYHDDVNNIGDGKKYWKGWRGKVVPTAGELAVLVKTYVNSPCLWASGIRKKDNFRLAEWIGLDFDEGLSIDEAKKIFEPHIHVIGTTKSHQVEKGGVKCDRFRVFLKLQTRIKSKEEYEATVGWWIDTYGADKACRDAARFFWPCKEIILFKGWGRLVPVVQPAKKRPASKIKDVSLYNGKEHRILPTWIKHVLKDGTSASRNTVTYKIARDLCKLGYSQAEVSELIMSSSLPGCKIDSFTKAECDRAIQSGFKK
jgi:hypothetical protein